MQRIIINVLADCGLNGWRRTHQMLIDADGEFEALVDQSHFDKKDFAKTLKEMSLGFYRFRIEK